MTVIFEPTVACPSSAWSLPDELGLGEEGYLRIPAVSKPTFWELWFQPIARMQKAEIFEIHIRISVQIWVGCFPFREHFWWMQSVQSKLIISGSLLKFPRQRSHRWWDMLSPFKVNHVDLFGSVCLIRDSWHSVWEVIWYGNGISLAPLCSSLSSSPLLSFMNDPPKTSYRNKGLG